MLKSKRYLVFLCCIFLMIFIFSLGTNKIVVSAADTSVNFEDRSASVTALTGTYGGIDWGSSDWYTDSGAGKTVEVWLNNSATTLSKTITLPTGYYLESVDIWSTSSSTVVVSSSGNTTKTFTTNSTKSTYSTGWTTNATSVTIQVTNSSGVDKVNFDNIVYSSGTDVTTTEDFESRGGSVQALTGTYGGINWGTTDWYTDSGAGKTVEAWLNSSSTDTQSRTITLPSGNYLKSVDLWKSSGLGTATVVVSSTGNTTKTFTANGTKITYSTGWTVAAASVTIQITSTTGAGDVNFDNFVYYGSPITSQRNSKIVSTVYPTEDIVISDYDVTDFGADSTGTNDSTTAIQDALNTCRAEGGGTVYLPAGTYKVSRMITVPPFCQIRGDWRDPDSGSGSYGTVISAVVPAGTTRLFFMSCGAGAVGLTVYYPNQSATNPVDYGWAFDWPCQINGCDASGGFQNITLLNSYKGISICATDDRGPDHCNGFYDNLKGTALYCGLMVVNAAGTDNFNNIKFDNSYWANAGSSYNAPSKTTLDTWTRANGTAFRFSHNEADQFFKLTASNYKYGIHIDNTIGTPNWGNAFIQLNITNTDMAIYDENSGRQMAIIRSTLSGSQYSIRNISEAQYLVTDCSLTGSTSGDIIISNPGTSLSSYPENTATHKPSRAVLYDVTKSPYNAPYTKYNTSGNIPSADATTAIQNALNDAGNAGGGVVYTPAGFFRINTHLSIPANVELRGALNHGKQPQWQGGGTILLAYEGEGTSSPTTATAFITINGAGSGVRGISVLHPNNPVVDAQASSWKVYPYTFRINGYANTWFMNNNDENGYLSLNIKNGSNSHYVKNFLPCCLSKGITVGTCTEGWIENIHDCGPGPADGANYRYGISPWFRSEDNVYILQNSDLITINGASNEHLLNIFSFSNRNSVVVTSGTVDAWNVGADVGNGYCIKATGGTVRSMNSLRTYGPSGTTNYGLTDAYNEMREI